MRPEPERASRHGALADAQGVIFGASMGALGIAFLAHLGLVTGQTAGIALLVSMATGWPFGVVFLALNLPFMWLAWTRMGPGFTIKTLLSVALVSLLTAMQPRLVNFGHVDQVAGAVLAGMISGAGLLALFRHGASLGGIGVLGVWLQDRTGFRAGYTQMVVDAGVFVAALVMLPLRAVLLSLLGAIVLNACIAINHRRDWYVAI
ncbi:YitT family protein [Amaricoccus sp.]|uniref:YitT family protein n=1 Tax=Amaricoccus sp. TaxID=1872485 RepID=UPI0025C09176|nr:YitT family protein [Amaricoccus sp.]